MISFKDYSTLDDFLHGKLDALQHQLVAKELSANPDMQSTATNLELINEAFVDLKLLQIEKLATTGYKDFKKKQQLKKRTLIAGIILGVSIITGAILYVTLEENSSEQPVITPKKEQFLSLSPQNTKEPKSSVSTKVLTPHKESHNISEEKHVHQETPAVSDLPVITPAPATQTLASTEVEEVHTSEITIEDPCLKNDLSLTTSTTASCNDTPTGSVTILAKGGMKPYKLAVFNEPKTTELNSTGLSPGFYTATVSDQNGCYNELVFEITSKLCPQDYEFNPSIGQVINFGDIQGKLRVHTPAGQLYFENELNDSQHFEWNGRSMKGKIVSGYYIYSIEQGGQPVKLGSITITE